MYYPLQQSWEFYATARFLGWPVQRQTGSCGTVWNEHRREVSVLGHVRLISRGPAHGRWLEEASEEPGPILLNPETAAGWREAGAWPLLSPATIARLPLGEEDAMRAALAQKWRNRLNAAQRAGVTTRVRVFPAEPGHWLLREEAAQARSRRYRRWPAGFCAAYSAANPAAARLVTATLDGQTDAAALLLVHGRRATWQIGVTRPAGRAVSAMNAVLWQAMCWAAARGLHEIDLGTVDTVTAPGLARFKLRTGAAPVALGGTWLLHPVLAPLARRLPAGWAGTPARLPPGLPPAGSPEVK
ncbi:GNAT family N-acetyltransferase [Roseivivax sediminis]|uniref:Acetyltransferase (GNAT) domain-containing protein n=1 Tax=Roseivivax sediminis TaxID=936889 RepID=A0A1I1VKX9_9RHOB|nr:GNAT family N-acetyltransferase [Roseivivax sediminis]SFD81190.1 Acetyltransferase (GNAT) domain-containing protein [Roseivivax sediminis]